MMSRLWAYSVFACVSFAAEIPASSLEMFAPLPGVMASPSNPLTEAKTDLGRMLYYEPRLSKNQKISCNSCHGLNTYGVDNKPTSDGHKGQTIATRRPFTTPPDTWRSSGTDARRTSRRRPRDR